MDGATFHERLRILLHDKGEAYVIQHPYWSPELLADRAEMAIALLYSTLVERAEMTGQPLVVLNNMIASASATDGSAVPDDFDRVIIGKKSTGEYVNTDLMPVAAASAGFDVVYVSAGKWRGTADTAWYWRKPIGPWDESFGDINDMPDAFYDTAITLTAIEVLMGEQQGAGDRIDLLYEMLQEQMQSLN